ncbi:hypothetical protein F5Y05DRAFT_380655 [Hypoxylon sp. FL0543]|nr:hypothetical protein F5Y05DRAFT_380655 [Hypoxylon sp. FL0543]
MDEKVPPDAPPPYTALPSSSATTSDELQLNSLTSHLQHHVASLPDRIRVTQQARKAEQTLSDASLLDHIVPIVDEFLADLGARHGPVPLATLTLVPDAALPENAVLSGMEDMKRRGEVCRVSRVPICSHSKDSKSRSSVSKSQNANSDPSWASGQEFSGWGRFGEPEFPAEDVTKRDQTLWWHDEEMAHRLASYLQPQRERKECTEHRSAVQVVVEQRIPPKKEKKGWLWGRRPSLQRPPESSAEATPVGNGTEVDKQQDEQREGAEMMVSAREVAFRQENEFGILESLRGWAIVVAVQVRT